MNVLLDFEQIYDKTNKSAIQPQNQHILTMLIDFYAICNNFANP